MEECSSDPKFNCVGPFVPYNRTTEEILMDIWHNQATIIKWLSKIAENTKPLSKWENIK